MNIYFETEEVLKFVLNLRNHWVTNRYYKC